MKCFLTASMLQRVQHCYCAIAELGAAVLHFGHGEAVAIMAALELGVEQSCYNKIPGEVLRIQQR